MEVIMNFCYLLFSFVFFSIFLYYLFIRSKADHVLQLPPGPYAWPIVGNIFNLNAKKPHITLANLAQIYGPLISLKLGSRLVIVASSPAAAREVFQSHDRELCGRYITRVSCAGVPKISSSVMTMCTECNENWRFLRHISHHQLFSSQALESHSKLRVKKVGELLEFLGSKDGSVVEIPNVVFANVANTLSNIMVSQDVIDCQDQIGEMRRFARRVVEIAIPGLVDVFPAFLGLDFWSHPKAMAFITTNKAIWENIISQRRSQDVSIRSRDLLDVLIQNSFDDNQISNFLIEMFVTSETITIAIEWAMAELTRNQKVLAKLRDELSKAVEGTTLHDWHLDKLPYLQACIKEILRLHPPNPLLVPRRATETCKAMNYIVPRDCWVIVNAYAIGRDTMTWEDPLSFKPERFMGKNFDLKGTCHGLLPFGGGRRICVGLPLALKQIQLLLASLICGFDWSPPSGTEAANLDMSEKFVVSLRMENPLLLIPRKRNELKPE